MFFELTEEQRMLRDMVREFGEKEIAPHCDEWEEAGQMPMEMLRKMAGLGLWSMRVPDEYGGNFVPFTDYMVAIEEMAYWSASVAIVLAVHNSIGAAPILIFGTEEQKNKYLSQLVTDRLGCFCLTEPGSGSDAAALRTTAKLDGDHYVLDGTKIYVTNGDVADIFIIFARTNPDLSVGHRGISAFIVERDTPGLKMGTKEKKMGLRASGTMEVILEDCKVSVDNRLGDEGVGFKVAMSALDTGRIGVAAQAQGVARRAYTESVKYAKERQAFGKSISDFQAIQWKLADMKTQLDASWLMVLKAAAMVDAGKRVTREAAEAKLFAADMSSFVTDEAVQIHGGYGYIQDYIVERLFRDSRVMSIYEGTSEIQRLVIAREELRD